MNEDRFDEEKRRRERLNLSLPMRAYFRESAAQSWDEVTRTNDVTPFGAGFTISRYVKTGTLMKISLPLPRQLRCFDHLESQYEIWCLVRHISRLDAKESVSTRYMIGVAFVGKTPPNSYNLNPQTRYTIAATNEQGLSNLREMSREEIAAVTAAEHAEAEIGIGEDHINPSASPKQAMMRPRSRLKIPLPVRIEVIDGQGNLLEQEASVTENISRTGAAIFTSLNLNEGQIINFSCDQYNVSLVAVVRGRRIGENRIPRLHVEFLDRQFPLEDVE